MFMGTSDILQCGEGAAEDQLPSTECDEQASKSVFAYALWGLGSSIAVLAFYMATVGPAAWLHQKGYFRKGIEIVYFPAESLYKASPTPVKTYLDRYVDFWTKHV